MAVRAEVRTAVNRLPRGRVEVRIAAPGEATAGAVAPTRVSIGLARARRVADVSWSTAVGGRAHRRLPTLWDRPTRRRGARPVDPTQPSLEFTPSFGGTPRPHHRRVSLMLDCSGTIEVSRSDLYGPTGGGDGLV